MFGIDWHFFCLYINLFVTHLNKQYHEKIFVSAPHAHANVSGAERISPKSSW